MFFIFLFKLKKWNTCQFAFICVEIFLNDMILLVTLIGLNIYFTSGAFFGKLKDWEEEKH